MTTTTITSTHTTSTNKTATNTKIAGPRPVAPVIETMLDAIRSGSGIPIEIYAADVELDATVPNWRFRRSGADAVVAEYGRWFADPATTEELDVLPVEDGCVLRYLLSWQQDGVPHAAHHAHVITLDSSGRIHKDVVFCGGRWDAALLAEIAEASR
jgi:hypothetical protein